MAQFEPKKMRKLCTDEVGRVKMKKNEKKTTFCNSKNCIFFTALFLAALQSKDDLQSLRKALL